jgi:hypothetical protein
MFPFQIIAYEKSIFRAYIFHYLSKFKRYARRTKY